MRDNIKKVNTAFIPQHCGKTVLVNIKIVIHTKNGFKKNKSIEVKKRCEVPKY